LEALVSLSFQFRKDGSACQLMLSLSMTVQHIPDGASEFWINSWLLLPASKS
jgi:hypothetical protein